MLHHGDTCGVITHHWRPPLHQVWQLVWPTLSIWRTPLIVHMCAVVVMGGCKVAQVYLFSPLPTGGLFGFSFGQDGGPNGTEPTQTKPKWPDCYRLIDGSVDFD